MIPTPINLWTSSTTPTLTFVEVFGYYNGKRQCVVFAHDGESGLMWEAGF